MTNQMDPLERRLITELARQLDAAVAPFDAAAIARAATGRRRGSVLRITAVSAVFVLVVVTAIAAVDGLSGFLGLPGSPPLVASSTPDAASPTPTIHQELILDITNNRDEPLVLRVVPGLLQITGPPAPEDVGQGEGSEVAGGERATIRLAMTGEEWTVTVNGSPMIRSDEHGYIAGGWTAGRMVVDQDEAYMELDRPEAAPSN